MSQALTTVGPEVFVQIGRRRYPVRDFKDASQKYEAARDAAWREGADSDAMPRADVVDATGRVVGHISQNGRVWQGDRRAWTSQTPLLYDTRVQP